MDFHQEEMRQARAQAEEFNRQNMAKMKKKSAAFFDFVEAVEMAKGNAESDGIVGHFNEYGERLHYPRQAIRAACDGREDTAAVLMIQLKLLQRLDRNRNYMWMIIALLVYIASQVG